MAYRLGIDLGTSTTVAVLAGPGSTRPLLFDASPLLSSAVFAGVGPDLLTGLDAERAAIAQPAGLEANPKRRIDDGTIWLGERDYPVAEVLAAILRRVAAEAHRVAGEPIRDVVLTHPAAWGRTRLSLLAEAAERAGFRTVGLVPEPVAAAAYFATVRDLAPAQTVVVYDLGAGTFDVSVVRRPAAGGFEVIAADGLTDVGGLDLDAAVVQHARSLTPGAAEAWGRLDWPQNHADQQARRTLWTGARAAKEQLTRHATADLHLPLVDKDLHLTREEFEAAARPYLDRTVALTVKVLRDAGAVPERIGGVFLVGGSSRIPLAATLLHRTLRIAPTIVDQPELVVAEGSLLAPVSTLDAALPTEDLTPLVAYYPTSPPTLAQPLIWPSPVSPAPVSPSPVSPAPAPTSPAPAPVSAPPVSAPPVSAPPVSAPPVSAPPVSAPPAFVPPVSAPPVLVPPVSPAPALVRVAPASTVEAPAPRRHWGMLVLAAVVVLAVVAGILGVRYWQNRGPVVAELHGAVGAVRAVAFSPDGKLLAAVGDDKTLRLWDVDDEKATTLSTSASTHAVAFSPDGKLLAAGGDDQRIHLFDLATRSERGPGLTLNRQFTAYALTFDRTSAMLVVGGEGGIALAYDVAAGTQINEFDAFNPGTINAAAFNPGPDTPKEFALGGTQPVVGVWSTATGTGRQLESSTRHESAILTVAYNPAGSLLASGGQDGAILLWTGEAGISASKLTGHQGPVNAVAFARNGTTLASGGDDETVRLWDAPGLKPLGTPFTQAASPIYALAFSPKDQNRLATGSRDGVVRIWDVGRAPDVG